MGRTLDHDAKRNGATALLESHNVNGFVQICESFANTRGHFWATTKPYKKETPLDQRAALNRATGKSHPTIVEYRKFCKAHGVFKEVPRSVIDAVYEPNEPSRPSKAVTVWEITGVIKLCDGSYTQPNGNPCDCKEFLHGVVKLFYTDLGDELSQKSLHKGSTVVEGVPVEGLPPKISGGDDPTPDKIALTKDQRAEYYNAILLHQFKIRHFKGMKLGKKTSIPVSNCLTALLDEGLTLKQYLSYAQDWADDNRNGLTPIQSPAKLALAVLAHSQGNVSNDDYDPALAKMRAANNGNH